VTDSRSELERRLDDLDHGDNDGPDEVVINISAHNDGDPKLIQRQRAWRDENGEWQSEWRDFRE
jgi:hypothetical protein